VNGSVVRELDRRVDPDGDRIELDGAPVVKQRPIHIALNKPRGLVVTRDDPQGRPTVYSIFEGTGLPFVGPVGRLDRASEGLLLLTNDSRWAARLLSPESHVDKTYHVQVKGRDLDSVIERVGGGVVEKESGELLSVKSIQSLRVGSRSTAWFEVVLDEGKNRQLRRIFAELLLDVQRIVRVSIGPLALGELKKGEWRYLSPSEVKALSR
jgi:23S rRNA pseudouridine2605 synthase